MTSLAIIESTNENGTQKFSYDELNQRVSETDREGNTTYYEHDIMATSPLSPIPMGPAKAIPTMKTEMSPAS